MQEDALAKLQQQVSFKHAYSRKQHDQFPQDSHSQYQNPRKSKKKNKKNHSNASEFLSFKFEPSKDQKPCKFVKSVHKSVTDITLSPYFRFAVIPGDYSLYHSDPNMTLSWDSVQKVTILADSEIKCPICLESELLVGRANKCGHYFCWPCIIRYMWVTQGTKRCPVCSDSLRAPDLRPISFRIYQNVTENEPISFDLMKRPKGMITIFKENHDTEGTYQGIVKSNSSNAIFNRISIYNQNLEDHESEFQTLTNALETSDEFEKSSIQRALEILEKNAPVLNKTLSFNSALNTYGFYYFYQISDSQPYFLHPLNISMLRHQLKDYENFPKNITGKILEIERVYITEQDQRNQISHLAKNAVAYFVEIDMKPFCDSQVLTYFKDELVRREKARFRFRKIEEKIQAKISIRRKGEEEANNLLSSYFENPKYAPVHTLPLEIKPEIKSESVEEKKEEPVSKSIWSNFSEVLKRPPREKKIEPAPEKAIESKEEEEGPRKLTMFDLIKSKKLE